MSLTNEQMIDMYKRMTRIRLFEECIEGLTASGSITGFVHLYIGQEAVATGVCANLTDADYVTSTHRGHGHLIAKGGKTDLMMAELFAKKTGYCKGKGGSMHIADIDLGILGANGIVGGGPPIAVGAGLSCQMKGTDNVSISFFGDGASNQGTVHEAMNLAALWKLPVVFVVEENQYGEMTRQSEHQTVVNVADRAVAYNMPAVTVDGNDVLAVYEAAGEAIKRARAGEGPSMVECKTFRIKGHYIGDPEGYRDKEEVKEWQTDEKDPIPRFVKVLVDKGVATEAEIEAIKQEVQGEIDKAVEFAQEGPTPEPADLLENVYA